MIYSSIHLSCVLLFLFHFSLQFLNSLTRLIAGFFTRLEASRKYIFGVASVYGTANDSILRGAFVVRGQDATPAFDVAPDFDSYSFIKLDPSKEEDREFINDEWSCDRGIEEGGKKLEWADGKVFK